MDSEILTHCQRCMGLQDNIWTNSYGWVCMRCHTPNKAVKIKPPKMEKEKNYGNTRASGTNSTYES